MIKLNPIVLLSLFILASIPAYAANEKPAEVYGMSEEYGVNQAAVKSERRRVFDRYDAQGRVIEEEITYRTCYLEQTAYNNLFIANNSAISCTETDGFPIGQAKLHINAQILCDRVDYFVSADRGVYYRDAARRFPIQGAFGSGMTSMQFCIRNP